MKRWVLLPLSLVIVIGLDGLTNLASTLSLVGEVVLNSILARGAVILVASSNKLNIAAVIKLFSVLTPVKRTY